MECSVIFNFDQEFIYLQRQTITVLPIGIVDTTRREVGPGMGSKVWGVRVTLYVDIGCRPVSLHGEEYAYSQSTHRSEDYIVRASPRKHTVVGSSPTQSS